MSKGSRMYDLLAAGYESLRDGNCPAWLVSALEAEQSRAAKLDKRIVALEKENARLKEENECK